MQAMRILLILVCTALIEANPLTNGDTGRIAYGDDFVPEKFPYVVAFMAYKDSSKIDYKVCTGTLVSAWYVLTAAHCTKGEKVSYIEIHLGTANGKGVGVEKVYQHKLYEPFSRADLSLLKLKSTFSSVKEYANTNGDISDLGEKGLKCTIIGFGRTEKGSIFDNGKMAQIILKSGQKGCELTPYVEEKGHYDEFLCTKPSVHTACPGDSGGPVICNGIQYGVASYLYNYKNNELPGVCGSNETMNLYVYIKKYKSWMEEIMEGRVKHDVPVPEVSKSSSQKVYTVLTVLMLCINIKIIFY